MLQNPIPVLRKIALWEAVSYLLLLGIAMPLKYIWGKPLAVKVVGMAHGVLFVLFCAALAVTWLKCKWPFGRVVGMFIASLLPFGPFFFDRRMPEYEKEFAEKRLR